VISDPLELEIVNYEDNKAGLGLTGAHLYSPISALFSEGLTAFSKSRRKRSSSEAAVPSNDMRRPPEAVGR
jgi:hypothetical protein